MATTPRRRNGAPSTLGAFLREARERLARRNRARVRQADVAEHADITVEWYARIERGSVLPSFDVLSRIAAALCLSSQALRFVIPEQLLRRDDLDRSLARAERGVLAVGAIDLPVVAPTMLRALGQVARGDGLSVRQTGYRWFEQARLLEDDRLDVAIAYRFAGVDVREQFGEYVVANEFSRAIATTSEWSPRAGAVTGSDLFEGTLHGPPHRVGNDMLQSLRIQGFGHDRYRGLPSLMSVAAAMRGKDYAFARSGTSALPRARSFVGEKAMRIRRWRASSKHSTATLRPRRSAHR